MAAKSNIGKSNLKQVKKSINNVRLTITSCINNTFMCLSHTNGDVIYNVSCGKLGIKNSKKNTPFAIEKLCDNIVNFLKDTSVKTMEVAIKGNIGANFLSKFDGHSFAITSVESLNSIAHNGVKKRKEKKK